MSASFEDISFPARLAFGSGSGIERRTQIVTLASGFERRIAPWALGRRRYLIGAGVRPLDEAAELLAFFEAREGPLIGFRFRDFADWKSGLISAPISPLDQALGTGDGVTKIYPLLKAYGGVKRAIKKPVAGSVRVAKNGVEISAFSVDETTGEITFEMAHETGAILTAGFAFDVPVRFESDRIDLTLESAGTGRVGAVSLIEIRV